MHEVYFLMLSDILAFLNKQCQFGLSVASVATLPLMSNVFVHCLNWVLMDKFCRVCPGLDMHLVKFYIISDQKPHAAQSEC